MKLLLASGILAISFALLPASVSAATYYLSPTGNDNGNGSASSPWKTIKHANTSVASGDTIILRDGVYSVGKNDYISITKSNTTWKAENKHKAIIDGGFSPSLLSGDWSNIKNVWDAKCGNTFARLLSIKGHDITIDGLFLRNSCGGGFSITDTGGNVDNVTIKNSKVDWTFIAGMFSDGLLKNFKFVNNELTRISFNDVYEYYKTGGYKVNISMHIGGVNTLIKNNLIAWGRGEIAITGSSNMTFENNTVIGSKNNFYSGNAEQVTVRNNLFWSPEDQLNPNTHWEKNKQDNDWHVSSRNEGGTLSNKQNKYVQGLHNIAYYNNLFINNSVQFNGYHKGSCKLVSKNACGQYSGCELKGGECTGRTSLHSINENIYFGHNTIVGGKDTNNNGNFDLNALFQLSFNADSKADGDAKFTGVIENNIFEVSKEPEIPFTIKLSGNDNITFRNNVLPASLASNSPLRGNGDIYYAQSQLTNALVNLDFPIPAVGAPSVDVEALRQAVNTANYHLKQSSSAINAGNGQIPVVGEIPTTKLQEAKKFDYNYFARVGLPDIGAFELNSTQGDPTHTPTPTPESDPEPDVIWDLNEDGRVNIYDYSHVTKLFGQEDYDRGYISNFIDKFRQDN